MFKALNITTWTNMVWIGIGLLGQVAFSGRMILQWIVSEKHRRSVISESFWWFSLFGGLTLFSYFVWRADPVGILGQASGIVIYIRNIRLLRKHARREARAAAPAMPPVDSSPRQSVAVVATPAGFAEIGEESIPLPLMRVVVDNQSLSASPSSIAEALSVARLNAEQRGRVVIEATLDGQPLNDSQLSDPPHTPCKGLEMRFVTAEPAELVGSTLAGVAESLADLREGRPSRRGFRPRDRGKPGARPWTGCTTPPPGLGNRATGRDRRHESSRAFRGNPPDPDEHGRAGHVRTDQAALAVAQRGQTGLRGRGLVGIGGSPGVRHAGPGRPMAGVSFGPGGPGSHHAARPEAISSRSPTVFARRPCQWRVRRPKRPPKSTR